MPWWFWVLLWAVLLVGTAGAAVGGGFRLVRQALRVMHDAGESLARVTALRAVGDGGDEHVQVQDPRAPGSAVFADPDAMRLVYVRGKAERRDARTGRRVARRAQRGQAQSLSDLGLI